MTKAMLIVLFFTSLVIYTSAGPVPKEFEDVAPEIRKICLAESGTTNEMVNEVGLGKFTEDDKLKCYLRCLFDQFRLMTPKGLNFKGFLALSPPNMKEKAVVMVEKCKETKGTDSCDLAYNINYCFYKTYPVEFFII
ncbi:hypothetical protein HCN44_002385 [Aphidius gifuensis]|uniref:Odorant-binding protein n=1 Tax=Aphidius gifuensis TaxID=684658 RepID=A0A835CV10_APHGI|nr:hypothetical protein HCN44_002385 [Aphidius gifuensis]